MAVVSSDASLREKQVANTEVVRAIAQVPIFRPDIQIQAGTIVRVGVKVATREILFPNRCFRFELAVKAVEFAIEAIRVLETSMEVVATARRRSHMARTLASRPAAPRTDTHRCDPNMQPCEPVPRVFGHRMYHACLKPWCSTPLRYS